MNQVEREKREKKGEEEIQFLQPQELNQKHKIELKNITNP
jgi:hypothetical protein